MSSIKRVIVFSWVKRFMGIILFMIVGMYGCPPIGQANGENRNTPGFLVRFLGNAIVVWMKKPCS
jgi:hypothetical protein